MRKALKLENSLFINIYFAFSSSSSNSNLNIAFPISVYKIRKIQFPEWNLFGPFSWRHRTRELWRRFGYGTSWLPWLRRTTVKKIQMTSQPYWVPKSHLHETKALRNWKIFVSALSKWLLVITIITKRLIAVIIVILTIIITIIITIFNCHFRYLTKLTSFNRFFLLYNKNNEYLACYNFANR